MTVCQLVCLFSCKRSLLSLSLYSSFGRIWIHASGMHKLVWPCDVPNLYQSDKKKRGKQKPRCRATGQFHGVCWWNPGALRELLFGVKCNIQPSTPLIFIDLPWITINTTFFAVTHRKWSKTHSYFQHHQMQIWHLQILQCTVAPMAKGSPKYTEY